MLFCFDGLDESFSAAYDVMPDGFLHARLCSHVVMAYIVMAMPNGFLHARLCSHVVMAYIVVAMPNGFLHACLCSYVVMPYLVMAMPNGFVYAYFAASASPSIGRPAMRTCGNLRAVQTKGHDHLPSKTRHIGYNNYYVTITNMS